MSQIAVGKLLPNLKVTIGNEETSENSDEGEIGDMMSDADEDQEGVKIVRSWMTSLQNPKIYKNKGGAFTTGLDLISEKNTEKLNKRAERFCIEKEEAVTTESIPSLYESMGIDIENRNSSKMKNMRLDALHMRGTNELNTHDIFQYFQDYGPASVEWINDFSCNVVWLDETTCARALLGISKPYQSSAKIADPVSIDCNEHKKDDLDSKAKEMSSQEEGEVMETEDESQETSTDQLETKPFLEPFFDIPVPPGNWRLGIPHTKAKSILLRFATKDDKKLPGAEKRSVFYKKYGNPNYGGLTGLISGSRKRKMLAASNKQAIEASKPQPLDDISESIEDEGTSDLEEKEEVIPKSRVPRMRMYADDEELKMKKPRFKVQTDELPKPSVHSRLGAKYTREDLCQLGVDLGHRRRPEFDLAHRRLEIDLAPRRRLEVNLAHRRIPRPEIDLRRKIRNLKEESDVKKHRSPLLKDD